VIDIFQQKGIADVNIVDDEEKNPLMHAVIRGHEPGFYAKQS